MRTENKNLSESIRTYLKEGVNIDYFDKFDNIIKEYISVEGNGKNKANQIATAVGNLIYSWYNDGDVFDNVHTRLKGWVNNISSYANWLYRYCKEAKDVLETAFSESFLTGKTSIHNTEYEELLKYLANVCLTEELLNKYRDQNKEGSIYDCEGPFKFIEENEEEEEEY